MYSIDQSPLYCLHRKGKLAELLHVSSASTLIRLSSDSNFRTIKKGNLVFTPPIGRLRIIHDRVQVLLSRIVPPDYLHSSIKGRSNLTNALAHNHNHGMVKTDIVDFFPSVSAARIKKFFLFHMRCSPDVAFLLSELLTREQKLPKGSPCSTSLAFWANKCMFDEIAGICTSANALITVYVDDTSISMKGLDRTLPRRINGVIKRYGYEDHKDRYYKPSQPKIVTGIVMQNGKSRVPKRMYKKLRGAGNSASDKGRKAYIRYVESGHGLV